jgi:Inhibitor of vertebrate lysozyme (Ivy)
MRIFSDANCLRATRRVAAALLSVQVAVCAVGARAVSELPYLYQQLDHPTYRHSFDALFRGEPNLAPWLRRYLNKRNGVDTPGQIVTAASENYELYEVCQPRNCPGNYIYVLFSRGGQKAWALFTREGGDYRFFGKPNGQQQALLTAAARR